MNTQETRTGDELSRDVHLLEDHFRTTKKLTVTIVRKELRKLAKDFHTWAHFRGTGSPKRWPKEDMVRELIKRCVKPERKNFYRKVSFDVDDMLQYVFNGRCGHAL